MRSTILVLALMALSGVAAAGDHVVDYDREVDFSAIRTFALRNTSIDMNRPEISNPLVIDRISGAVRAALAARGLEEVRENADVIVDWTVRGQGFFINQWGRAIPTGMGRGNDSGVLSEAFLEGTLVIDLTQRSPGLLIWRGVYRDNQRDVIRIAQKLPGYAKKLLAGYPRKKP